MKQEEQLSNNLRPTRTRLGLSQQQLAEAAGVARQTIGGIEGGLYSPSMSVALKLARSLGCTVEEIFWLEDDRPAIDAQPSEAGSESRGARSGEIRVSVARVGGTWIAHPLEGESAFRSEMVPADGVTPASGERWRVKLLDDGDSLARTVIVAGCAPALSLWSRSAQRWHPDLRMHWIHANSTEALAMLARGEVHAAGMHLHDDASASDNAVYVRAALPNAPVSLVNLGIWQEGILTAHENPRGIQCVSDLARKDVRIVNRERGAGSRALLEKELAEKGIAAETVEGFNSIAQSHEEVARRVAAGEADAGMSTESMAALFGLHFVPLTAVRYDIAILNEYLSGAAVRQTIATLDHRWIRSQLQVLGGYDTTRTGEVSEVK